MSASLSLFLMQLLLADAEPTKKVALPDSVKALFEEKGDDGKAILGDAERKHLEKLPEHARELIGKDVDDMKLAGAAHLKILLSLELSPQTAEIVFSDNCILCHTDVEGQRPAYLLSVDPKATRSPEHLNLKEFVSDVHFRRGLSCAGCHGGSPQDENMPAAVDERWPKRDARKQDRAWVVEFCGRCHADPNFMRGFNPSLPTDQVAKYKDSQHGILLLQRHDSKAANCVSCHGVHGIRSSKSRQSTVHPQRVPETCGHCHADADYMAGYTQEDGSALPTNQLADFKASVHGRALLEKNDLGAPACNDCHGNHAAMPPAVASVSQVCRTCHTANGALFDGSKHKKAFEVNKWPECGQCHDKHRILKPTDALISDDPSAGLCGTCHATHAKDNPACNDGARHFRDSIHKLTSKSTQLAPDIEHFAERGIDVEPLAGALAELDEATVQSRTRVHTFDLGGFDLAFKTGEEAIAKVESLLEAAREEYRFRRNGLLASIGAMSFLAVMLALKIRQLNKRPKR